MPNPEVLAQVVAHRRQRLNLWIQERFDGRKVAFIADCAERDHHINQGELSALLRKKSFGERKARNLESMAAMPPRWLDVHDPVPPKPMAPTPHKAAIHMVAEELPPPYMSWPFELVPYERLQRLFASLSQKQAELVRSTMDQQLHAIAFLWENTVQAERANGTAR